MNHRSFLLVALASACWLGACGAPDGGDSGGGGQAGSAGGDAGGSKLACSDDGNQVDLDGLFALSARLSFTFVSQPGGAVTLCPEDQVSEGSFLSFVKIEHAPGQSEITSVSATVCTLELPVISAIVGECNPAANNLLYAGLEFPQALLDGVPTASVPHTTATLTSLAPGGQFAAGALNFSIGTDEPAATAPTWQMTAPGCGLNDNAPGRSSQCEEDCVTDCSALVDDDADGWPGVTVHVCGYTNEDKKKNVPCNPQEPNVAGATIQGRALMNLQVEPLTLTGRVVSSCEIAGTLDASIAYNVVGADLYLANTQISVTSAIKSLPEYRVNKADSQFHLVRIDGKHGSLDWNPDWDAPLASCQAIIAKQNELN